MVNYDKPIQADYKSDPDLTDLDSPSGRAAPAGESGSEGIPGAPPGNTAPYNCNSTFHPLRWGLDSLYLSYPGELSGECESELRELKKIAQGPDYEAARAQIQLGNHFFEVKDKGSGLFAFTLVDDAFMIRLSAGKSRKLPMAYVQISSRLLCHSKPQEIEAELRSVLRGLGEVYSPTVSRADLFLDFASTLDMEGWRRDAWVTRAKAVTQYAEDVLFTGWTIGAGSALSARLYQKVIESKKSGKEYLYDLWQTCGWDGKIPVWRLEFQYKREVLSQLGLDSLPKLLEHQGALWNYATGDWLRLCLPSQDDKTRSRWPTHPIWTAMASIDWGKTGGPFTRNYTPSRAPSIDWLGSRCASVFASIGAVAAMVDFDAAAAEAKKRAYDALALKNGMSGISVDQFFQEKVEALTREYNLRMNPRPPKPAPLETDRRSEYERQSRG